MIDEARRREELYLCELAGCLRTHPYPLATLFDQNPPRCPVCGGSDTHETDYWGHPFGTYTCRACGAYEFEFERDGRIIGDVPRQVLEVVRQRDELRAALEQIRDTHGLPGSYVQETMREIALNALRESSEPPLARR